MKPTRRAILAFPVLGVALTAAPALAQAPEPETPSLPSGGVPDGSPEFDAYREEVFEQARALGTDPGGWHVSIGRVHGGSEALIVEAPSVSGLRAYSAVRCGPEMQYTPELAAGQARAVVSVLSFHEGTGT